MDKSAHPRLYADAASWQADAARFFAARIERLLDPASPGEATQMIGLVETKDARRLTQAIVETPLEPARLIGDQDQAAKRLSDPAALASLPIGCLMSAFNLSYEWALPIALLATATADARFSRLLAWLNDDIQRRHLTPALIAELCVPHAPDVLAWDDCALTQLACVQLGQGEAGLPGDRTLTLSPAIAAWLTGRTDHPDDPSLLGMLTTPAMAPLDVLMSEPTDWWPDDVFVVQGGEGTGRVATAAAIMMGCGFTAAVIDARHVQAEATAMLFLALRDTWLSGRGCIVKAAETLPVPLLRKLCDLATGPLAFVTTSRLPLDMRHIQMPELSPERTLALWQYRLGEERAKDAVRLAHQFRLNVDDLLTIPAGPAQSYDAIRAQCQHRASGRLDSHANLVPCLYDWDDLVLPPRQMEGLHTIVSRVKNAPQVFDTWGFARKLVPHRGLSALFSGPSGAGKTLSASIIAKAIGLPLYRVDLSATVSKYIGETEKNLEQIFSAAEESNACLLFDECDALFGKRSDVSDAHDRYANIETSYLLQRLEAHRGVVMMSSNHPQNIDEAFMRRIDVTIEFALPDARLRKVLWQRLLPKDASASIDPTLLGERFELSGGSIRNCLVSAAFLAADAGERMQTAHCVRAVAQEYEKIGRPLTRSEFGDAYPALRARRGA